MDITVISRFHDWLVEEGKSVSTIASYIGDVKKFNEFLAEKDVDVEMLLSRFLFTSYLKHLEQRKAAISTINKIINSLKVYNDFLYQMGLVEGVFISIKKDKVKIASGSEAEVSILTDVQIETFLFHLEKESQRNKLIGYILLYTGIRVSELIQIQLTDIDQLTSQLTIKGKGGKIRNIPLRKDVLEILQSYLHGDRKKSKFNSSNYLLVSQRAEKMHRDAVRRWLEQVGKHLGFHIHPHMLRHTFCTRLLQNGVDITTVSKLAGHANLNMTVKYYINTSKEEKKNAVEKL